MGDCHDQMCKSCPGDSACSVVNFLKMLTTVNLQKRHPTISTKNTGRKISLPYVSCLLGAPIY